MRCLYRFAQSFGQGSLLVGRWGMSITVAVALFVLLYILTVSFIKVGQELKRDFPRLEE